MSQYLYIDPSSEHYYQNRLFDLDNGFLNRDGTLEPMARLRATLATDGITVRTADYAFANGAPPGDYWSTGVLANYQKVATSSGFNLSTFIIFEPPVVMPHLYRALPDLTRVFKQVYVHNVHGDGYSLKGVDASRLRKLHWPLPYAGVLEPYWSRQERQKKLVVINGSHRPRSRQGELYSRRIEAMVALADDQAVDLYGRDWHKWWSPRAQWWPYWRNRRKLLQVYKGACASKFDVLSQYDFSLCFENMQMAGYVTEKLFDCLYAGTVPVYLGAPDIQSYVPAETYIDMRQFDSWADMWRMVSTLPKAKLLAMRHAGREFYQSEASRRYVHSLEDIYASRAPGGEQEN